MPLPSRRLILGLLAPLMLFACDGNDEGDDENVGEDGTETADTTESGTETGEEGETGEYDCAAETRDDAFAIGLNKSGMSVQATFVSADPAPPFKGDNTWVLDFADLEGQALAGLDIVAIPMMPDHGHGTPIAAEVTPLDTAGQYEITPVNLFMAGYWEVTFEVTLPNDGQDTLVFGFCVE